jgi:hypothetical protein
MKVVLGGSAHFCTTVLTNKSFSRLKFFAFTKLSPACKFAGGIHKLQAAPIAFAIYR